MSTEKLFTRTGAAKQIGCSESSLMNYERRKVVRPQRLDHSRGRPVYRPADVERARAVYQRNKPRSPAARR